MERASRSDGSSGAERGTADSRRVYRRVEARNRLAGADAAGAFDFTVVDDASDPEDDTPLGVLASYIGAAACEEALSLGLSVDVSRVVVEDEGPPTRSDGGISLGDGAATDGPERPDDLGRSPVADSTLEGEPSRRRVRVLVEARTEESVAALVEWRDRLVGDRTPFSGVPALAGVDVVASTTAPPAAD